LASQRNRYCFYQRPDRATGRNQASPQRLAEDRLSGQVHGVIGLLAFASTGLPGANYDARFTQRQALHFYRRTFRKSQAKTRRIDRILRQIFHEKPEFNHAPARSDSFSTSFMFAVLALDPHAT
jgi:hypothetical protein